MSHVAIIGGGASGILAAVHLVARDPAIRITLLEPRPRLGGIAYGVTEPGHLLNLPSSQMSAFSGLPDHFTRWLARNAPDAARRACAPRGLYARYLGDLLAPALARGQVTWLRLGAEDLRMHDGLCVLGLSDGTRLVASHTILAVGHLAGRYEREGLDNPWDTALPAHADDPVVILGTGLSMADRALQLLAAGHRGQITAVSRHGLMPHHDGERRPLIFDRADLPLGASVTFAMRWLRAQTAWHLRRGGDWRDVIDGLGDAINTWWQTTSDDSRRRFLRHARRYWIIHRHRLPRQEAALLEMARRSGQLVVVKGRLDGITDIPGTDQSATGLRRARIRTPSGAFRLFDAAQIIDCRGILRPLMDRGDGDAPVGIALLDRLLLGGIAELDSFEFGLRLGPRGHLPHHPQIYAMGALRSGSSIDATSIRNIRAQAEQIAAALVPAPDQCRQSLA